MHLRCPQCGSHLHRRRRHTLERVISEICKRRPYYCTRPHCAWQGWLSILPESPSLDPEPALKPEFMDAVELMDTTHWTPLN